VIWRKKREVGEVGEIWRKKRKVDEIWRKKREVGSARPPPVQS
jgi:hypothetical protein